MKDAGLISVIVPIYKVEQYLHRCVDSILNQTYKHLEIILVDDGSPDGCPIICDEYAKKDSRVKVIHQENTGVSAARNVGLDIAKGDYITFVDSDDWLDLDTYEKIVSIGLKADIVLFNYVEEYEDRSVERKIDSTTYCNTSSIKKGFLYDTIGSYVWRGLYRYGIWTDIRFPLNTNYEDLAIIVDVVMRADNIEILDRCYYHYNFTNTGSITSSVSTRGKYGMFVGAKKRIGYALLCKDDNLYKKYYKRAFRTGVTGIGINMATGELWPKQIQDMKNYLIKCSDDVLDVGLKYRIIYWGIFHCSFIPKVYGETMVLLSKIKQLMR